MLIKSHQSSGSFWGSILGLPVHAPDPFDQHFERRIIFNQSKAQYNDIQDTAFDYVINSFARKNIEVRYARLHVKSYLNINQDTLGLVDDFISEIATQYPDAQFLLDFVLEMEEVTVNVRISDYNPEFLDFIESFSSRTLDQDITIYTDISAKLA